FGVGWLAPVDVREVHGEPLDLQVGSDAQQLGADRSKRLEGEDHLHRQAEVPAQLQGQLGARAVFAALQIADGLKVDAHRRGQLLARQAPLGPQYGYAVEHHAPLASLCVTTITYCVYTTIGSRIAIFSRRDGRG